jgi:glycosyltransferase involved in cell wall biosynthesis
MRLTIITPSFNQAAFLEKTIRSVLDQGWDDLEYFVLDAGSTDGSVDILRRYDDRITWWVSEPDDGQTDALNRGIARATGSVIGYVNSDDYYLPGAFEHAAELLGDSGPRWAIGASRVEDHVGGEVHTWTPTLPRKGRHWWLIDPWGYPQPSTFWRRDLFEEFGPFRRDLHYVFDTEFGLRLLLAGAMPAVSPRPLAVRVEHPAAKSWDHAPFAREQERFPELLGPSLSARERALLRGWQAFIGSPVQRALARASAHRRRLSRRTLSGPEAEA